MYDNDALMQRWSEIRGCAIVPSLNNSPFCRVINADSVRNACLAAGDLNSLWFAGENVENASDQACPAPPYMLFACAPWTIGGGVFLSVRDADGGRLPVPGASGVQGGITMSWHRPLRLGDQLACEARLAKAQTHKSRTWGRTFELVAEFLFVDLNQELVAEASFTWLGTEKGSVQTGEQSFGTKTWTAAEIDEVRAEYAAQLERSSERSVVRWEDVGVGDSLPSIVKGPYTETSYITFCTAFPLRNIHSTDEVYYNFVHDDIVSGAPNRGPLGAGELTRQGVPAGNRRHFDYDSARARGLPAPIDVGNQRVVWLIQLVTTWMGEFGFLKHLEARHLDVNMMGDLSRCSGKVVEKAIEDDEHLVRCELTTSSHRGPSTLARCTVALPSRRD